jgi:hypothetical protein
MVMSQILVWPEKKSTDMPHGDSEYGTQEEFIPALSPSFALLRNTSILNAS